MPGRPEEPARTELQDSVATVWLRQQVPLARRHLLQLGLLAGHERHATGLLLVNEVSDHLRYLRINLGARDVDVGLVLVEGAGPEVILFFLSLFSRYLFLFPCFYCFLLLLVKLCYCWFRYSIIPLFLYFFDF